MSDSQTAHAAQAADPRRVLAPLQRRLLSVSANERLGAYRVLKLADPEGRAPAPGQFTMLAAAERWGGGEDERPHLPRAFSVARVADGEAHYLLEDVGPGTHRLCELAPGRRGLVLRAAGQGIRPARERAASAAGRRRRGHRSAGDPAGRPGRALPLGRPRRAGAPARRRGRDRAARLSRRRARERRSAAARRRGWPATTARSAMPGA